MDIHGYGFTTNIQNLNRPKYIKWTCLDKFASPNRSGQDRRPGLH